MRSSHRAIVFAILSAIFMLSVVLAATAPPRSASAAIAAAHLRAVPAIDWPAQPIGSAASSSSNANSTCNAAPLRPQATTAYSFTGTPLVTPTIDGPFTGQFVDGNGTVVGSATQPITYHWQATNQSAFTVTAGLSTTTVFTWFTPGTKTITVTASNVVNSKQVAGTIEIRWPHRVYLPIVLK
jgi:hypothetical protein